MAATIDRLDETLLDWFERPGADDQRELIVETAVHPCQVSIRRGVQKQPGVRDSGNDTRDVREVIWRSLGEMLASLVAPEDVVPLKSARAFCVLASPDQTQQILASDLVRRMSPNRRRTVSQ
ncbi:MAG: hypothetical protein ACYTGL_24295 [Planctomycetota bacterium]|jgi:hypothetical protein